MQKLQRKDVIMGFADKQPPRLSLPLPSKKQNKKTKAHTSDRYGEHICLLLQKPSAQRRVHGWPIVGPKHFPVTHKCTV